MEGITTDDMRELTWSAYEIRVKIRSNDGNSQLPEEQLQNASYDMYSVLI